jgi:hypothetical protein
MMPRLEGSRDQTLTSPDGGVAHRGWLVPSAPRRAASQRPVEQPWLTPSAKASTAFRTLGSYDLGL